MWKMRRRCRRSPDCSLREFDKDHEKIGRRDVAMPRLSCVRHDRLLHCTQTIAKHLPENKYFRGTYSETWQCHVSTSGSSVVPSDLFIPISTRPKRVIYPGWQFA